MEPVTLEHFMPLIQIGSAIVTAVWAVFKIKSTTERLGDSIDHLKEVIVDVKRLQLELDKDCRDCRSNVSKELGRLKERLIRIESYYGGNHGGQSD